ncbi:hypothetical protein [Pseudalkalibacillus sp. SCS-8]|uniref:DUF7878 domain-containing protein n=1 Tax=Pseudalkalibacillus nanhaiensis TaxID=3115291 RepID=UPI0032DB53C4
MGITFTFKINPEQKHSAYELGYMEGELNIHFNQKLFFHDPHNNLAELAAQLDKWMNSGSQKDFIFKTIDHDEPILTFQYESSNQWRLHSIWQNFEPEDTIHTIALKSAAKKFLENLNKEFNRIGYDVKFDDHT